MCGIGAYLPTPERRGDSQTTLALIRSALLTLETRGRDSTGVAAIHEDGSTDVLKLPTAARVFLLTDAFLRWFIMASSREPIAWMLHTRAATQGAVALVNAHPFVVGGITAVHNGHVSNYHAIKAQYQLTSDCDSEVVAAALAESPITDYAQGTRKLTGSFALIAHDQRLARSLWVARNQNPLTITRAADHGVLLSSIAFDRAVTSLLPEKLATRLTQADKWKFVPADKQYRIDLDTLKYAECGAFETNRVAVIYPNYSTPVGSAWKADIIPPLPADMISLRSYMVGLDSSQPPSSVELYNFDRCMRRQMGFSKAYIEKHRKALLYFYLRGKRIAAPKGEPTNGPNAHTFKIIKAFNAFKHEDSYKKVWKQTERLLPDPARTCGEASVDPLGRGRGDDTRKAWWDDEVYRGRWAD